MRMCSKKYEWRPNLWFTQYTQIFYCSHIESYTASVLKCGREFEFQWKCLNKPVGVFLFIVVTFFLIHIVVVVVVVVISILHSFISYYECMNSYKRNWMLKTKFLYNLQSFNIHKSYVSVRLCRDAAIVSPHNTNRICVDLYTFALEPFKWCCLEGEFLSIFYRIVSVFVQMKINTITDKLILWRTI